MDETELENIVNSRLRSIDNEEYMIKTCSLFGDDCDYDDCSTCHRARAAIKEEILEEEEDRIKKNDPVHLLNFKPFTHEKTGLKYGRNDANTIAETATTESIISVAGLPSEGWNVIKDSPELDTPYPLWPKIRDRLNKETPVQELLFQDNELPLLIQCEGRVLAIAPYIK